MRSRAVNRPFLCCDSIAFAPPPTAICSSSFLICVTRSIIRRVFFSNSGAFVFTFDLRIEAATHRPHAKVAAQSDESLVQQRAANVTAYGLLGHSASRTAL